MAQELLGWRAADVQSKLRSWGAEERAKFIVERSKEYLDKEAKWGTYAGTAEAWALSEALGRPIQLFGNDFASSETVTCTEGRLLPYFDHCPNHAIGTPPIRAMQLWGGGHYHMLVGT